MRREVHVVPRAVLDARLVEHAVDRGAVLRRHRARTVEAGGPGHAPRVDDLGPAGVVVGADGAHSRARAALPGLRPPRRAFAVRGYAPVAEAHRGRQVIRFGRERQPSYAWSFDRGDGLANVGYGELVGTGGERTSRADLLASLDALLPGSVAAGGDWSGHHLPLSHRRWEQPDGRVLLAGDAAGLVNPMTGEGIYYAVATGALAGRIAAECVLAGRPEQAGARHRAAVRRLLGTHLRHTWAAGALAGRGAVVAAGIRAAARERAVFDDLVEIGLGGGRITPGLARGLAAELLPAPARRRPLPRPT